MWQKKQNAAQIFWPLAMEMILLIIVSSFYRVGQKSKLLILSEYVNKTEKLGGTEQNTIGYGENEALSDIFS